MSKKAAAKSPKAESKTESKTVGPIKTPAHLLKDALALLPANSPEGLRQLLEVLFHDIDADDLGFFEPQILAEMAESHWAMARERKPGQTKIKVYCPEVPGLEHRRTVVDIVCDDLAFLVDSTAAEINRYDYLINILIHPSAVPVFDEKKGFTGIKEGGKKGEGRQSHVHVQINKVLSKAESKALEQGLHKVLIDITAANKQWLSMLQKMKETSTELSVSTTPHSASEIQKCCAFLDYLADNNFTFLGYREYLFVDGKDGVKSKTVKGSSLGLLHDDVEPAYISESDEGLPRNLQELRRSLPPVSISKTNRVSTVHRRVPMDAIAVKTYDEKGGVKGERLFLGLFTSVTYSRSVRDVPYLRDKVEDVVQLSKLMEGSHDRRALRHILEKYPRDELFQIENDELLKICMNIIRLQERQRISLFLRRDPFGRYISCLVYVPRDRFGTKLRLDMEKILEEQMNGTCANFYTTLDDSVFARVMYVINVSQKSPPKFNAKQLEKMLRECGETWQEKLAFAVAEEYQDDTKVTDLTIKYREAFPVAYTENHRARQAVFDIEKIEQALAQGRIVLDLYRPNETEQDKLRLKVYHPGSPITLSDVLPILENMGLRAIAELPFEITPAGSAQSLWIHDFLLETPEFKDKIAVKDVKEQFEKAFTKIWYNEMESDGLNRLVLRVGANWREITILRSYVHYMQQVRSPFSRTYIQKALTDNALISRLLIDLFKAYHDPANGSKSKALAEACSAKIEAELEKVTSSDQDRILRQVSALVEATMRTNYYQRGTEEGRKPYLSLKLKSALVPDLPDPKPFMEIFVYSPRVEAIHLRGDKIARGGLRWSDRHEDFRTEVLGLMKAQMVKNAVIVPMGAKGGFVVKTPTKSREEYIKEGVECYKTFIRGLLDITDNLSGATIIPPKDVVRRDGDDPYLVVAADKGTATFSDTANGISQEYGFWMGDAFASGGSAGYDHKKMAITARGGWESVKAHFRLFNHDIQKKAFDATGIGDMAGDVFGNGMLLSEQMRLVAAFNHVHIFCDPDPDPVSSFKERKRLFDEVKGWDHYNTKLLSKGGRIFNRNEKVLSLTPEIQKRFDLPKDKATPAELIRAILKARTDLIWFGGIGTCVKATKETHIDVGDKANDALRVNASEIRARVIGEGANLALTQLGRIELSEKGVRLNTDFVDNSGGVDSSDHEVNIKILLTDVMGSKKHNMDIKARNVLLKKMTEEVASHVLRHNYQQAQAVSLAELQARENLQLHEDFIEDLERERGLNRKNEGLPDKETIEARLRAGKGLTRPELCILISYSKIALTSELLASNIPDNSKMENWLVEYFPDILGEKFRTEIKRHLLKREIIGMTIANSLVNRMGPTFTKSRMNKTGARVDQVVEAYIVTRDAFKLRPLWDDIESLDGKVPAEVQLKAMRDIAQMAEHTITWFLTRLGRDLHLEKDTQIFGESIESLRKNIDGLLTDDLKNSIQARIDIGVRDGLPQALARQIALMPVLSSACDIIRISLEQNTNMMNTTRTYFEVGEAFHLDWLRQQARFLPHDNHWQSEASAGLLESLYSCQAGLTVRVLRDLNGKAGKSPRKDSMLEVWLKDHGHLLKQFEPLFAELRRAGTVDLTMLAVAEQRLRQLFGG
ncbi:MAG: NAD-glutamate dehydrogenase [Alphaproteobacteria bacterium]|nr:NAD-glutamate dehydrogenase [Alphaproteobacteria bacterium]MBP7758105.1 NAD-glutamate dehydrogenase [Alphaproteobacteria bacterium]MBP7761462.1 NAD-glutamate dehydrogenase [Alphaproteobacteria bacterium]MBP7903803.1 NAD-glutamate dehydrogenase [Alphaproteobacteria bacterium]